jgi:hypothetical protein
MPTMGGASKYIVSGLFSTDCKVSRFHHRNSSASARRGGVVSYAS